jgi:hypothetical protein
MSDISTLKEKNNLKTFHFILLTALTMGLYTNVWLYKTAVAVEDLTGIKTLSTRFMIGYLTLFGFGSVLSNTTDAADMAVGFLLALAAYLLSLAWCFRVRRALRAYALTEHNFELRMNRIYSVLFTFYHVNYCINALPRDKQKHHDKKPPLSHSVQA